VIRDAVADDLEALARLTLDHPLFERYGLTAGGLEGSLRDAWAAGDGLLVAAEDGDRPIGFAWWVPRGAFARSPYLRLLVVAAAATGRGIGAALMEAVEGRARATGPDLFLLVTAENVAAQRFYERRGYRPVGRLEDYVRPGIAEILMRKRTAPG
jgi:ribosomal protein S18 acetylase RimI-like enzyme